MVEADTRAIIEAVRTLYSGRKTYHLDTTENEDRAKMIRDEIQKFFDSEVYVRESYRTELFESVFRGYRFGLVEKKAMANIPRLLRSRIRDIIKSDIPEPEKIEKMKIWNISEDKINQLLRA